MSQLAAREVAAREVAAREVAVRQVGVRGLNHRVGGIRVTPVALGGMVGEAVAAEIVLTFIALINMTKAEIVVTIRTQCAGG